MGFIGGMLGLNGGAGGTGFSGPQGVQTLSGTNAQQIENSYGGVQNSLASQQALLGALQAQNGLGNQSQVYNQLQGVASGTGPNPAQSMLNQATGANVANQAALMAGQRGSSQNAGLMARQAGQQGGAIQQQAVGQGATMQANQALGALSAAGNMANTQAGQQIAGTNANTSAQMNEQNMLQNAAQAGNNANIAMQSNINNANAGLAGQSMKGQQGLVGGILGGAGSALGLAEGGEVPAGPQSAVGKFFKGASEAMAGGPDGDQDPLQAGLTQFGAGLKKPLGNLAFALSPTMASGGKVPAMVSPGEKYLTPDQAREVASGRKAPSKTGETIPGKAAVKGDSKKNDTVPRMLEPGGVVVKRSIMNSEDSDDKAAKFVQAVLSKKGKRS